MVELKGSLNGVGISALVQLIGELHHSGSLMLRRDADTAELIFDDGRLVAAHCSDVHGLDAVKRCAAQFTDAEFAFIEGTPAPADGGVDLAPFDLKAMLSSNGTNPPAPTVNGNGNGHVPSVELACALLGFADDRSRHYARPTALHRCFAAGTPGLVTPTEQRELCLSGKFATCPRYRAGEQPRLTEDTVVQQPPPAPAPGPAAGPMPARVASRLAAAGRMRMGPKPGAPQPDEPAEPVDPRRRVLLIGGGAILALCLLAVLLFVALPILQRQATNTVAVEPVATATSALAQTDVPVTAPTRVPVAAPAATAAPRRPTPTTLPAPTVAAVAARLMDIRFAGGPADNWVDNAPYAGWSDGAYRLDSRDTTRFVAVAVPIDRVFSDVIVSATFRKTGGPPGGGYGLIVRAQDSDALDGVSQDLSGYVLETSDQGDYGVWRREGDHWVDLVPWTHSPSVRSGGSPNDLSVKAVGSELTFTVNGTLVATVDDDAIDSGRIGLFVGGDSNEVALDEFSVQLP